MPAINPFKSNVQPNAVSFATNNIVQQPPTTPRYNDINNINNINTRPMVRPL
jgi:hypothetical protein